MRSIYDCGHQKVHRYRKLLIAYLEKQQKIEGGKEKKAKILGKLYHTKSIVRGNSFRKKTKEFSI